MCQPVNKYDYQGFWLADVIFVLYNTEDSNRCRVNANVHVRAFANCSPLSNIINFLGGKVAQIENNGSSRWLNANQNKQSVVRIFLISELIQMK